MQVVKNLWSLSVLYFVFKAKSQKYSLRSPSTVEMGMTTLDSAAMSKQIFDYFLVLDFEATCEEGKKIMPLQEIIEFPVMQLCGRTFEEVGRFHRYVRPTERPVLTSFCTHLTGIVQKRFYQETVAKEETLPEILDAFHTWLVDSDLIGTNNFAESRFTFLTSGDWDLGVLLPNEARYRRLQLPEQVYFKRWINLKKAFCKCKGHFAKSLTVMLHDLKLDHVVCSRHGRLHSGIDDVKNMCQIAKCLANSGYLFKNTSIYIDEKRHFESL
ncbi:unnamed protein product [Thelazia callipaeda]|uniref:Exonuclease domain-containing protein n=1 Tax=Thelazia callipaeda TaxID=103827 RepID=A0A0N5CKD9_THECL|nr:unnamed protein product [Thelazia callipaeda]